MAYLRFKESEGWVEKVQEKLFLNMRDKVVQPPLSKNHPLTMVGIIAPAESGR